MADKVMWKRRGYFIAEEGTHTIVADCRYTQYNDADKHEGMIQEIIDSHNKGIEAMKLLESLTPSGSEFHNDPERCVEWVQYHVSGCTCRLSATLPDGRIVIGGIDDCPVHGFGIDTCCTQP